MNLGFSQEVFPQPHWSLLFPLPKIPKKYAPMMSNCLLRGTFRVKDGDAKSCSCPAFPTEIVSEKRIWGERWITAFLFCEKPRLYQGDPTWSKPKIWMNDRMRIGNYVGGWESQDHTEVTGYGWMQTSDSEVSLLAECVAGKYSGSLKSLQGTWAF